MDTEFRYVCKCGVELLSSHTGPCPKCGKSGEIHKVIDESLSDGIILHESNVVRQKRKGFGKFFIESMQGWFPSGDPKLKDGVDKVRTVDKEKNEYHETTRDVATGEITRDIHEPLNQHKHINK